MTGAAMARGRAHGLQDVGLTFNRKEDDMDFNLPMLIWIWILGAPLVLGVFELVRTPRVRRDGTNSNHTYAPTTTPRTVTA